MKGEQHEVVVESLANSGDGVGRINEKVVFIPFSCPGDHLKVKIVLDKKTFARAQILEVLQASPERVEPPCEYFKSCGGCDWQHVNYETQLYWKNENLIQNLKRLSPLEISSKVEPIRASPSIYNYRNRIQLHQDNRGFFYFKKNSSQPVYVEKCLLAEEPINKKLTHLKKTPSRKKVELATQSNEQVECYSVDKKSQSQLGFRQVNSQQNLWIQEKIAGWSAQYGIQNVLDLYCGQGNWAIHLAENLPSIHCTGIDESRINIQKAVAQAPENCQFLCGEVDSLFPQMDKKYDLVIIDPPRSGCTKDFLKMISEHPPKHMVYISCDPATLARDLADLNGRGWEIERIYPVDMFPQTAHLECLTFLHSAKASKTAY